MFEERLIDRISRAITKFKNTSGRRPDYVMIHPERAAMAIREFGDMLERGELYERDRPGVKATSLGGPHKRGDPFCWIDGVPVLENLWLEPLRPGGIEFVLMRELDFMEMSWHA